MKNTKCENTNLVSLILEEVKQELEKIIKGDRTINHSILYCDYCEGYHKIIKNICI